MPALLEIPKSCYTVYAMTGIHITGLTLVPCSLTFSSTPVCHPTKGPNRGSGPHCHFPLWDQRKPPACRLLAEGRESGESTNNSVMICGFSLYFLKVKLHFCRSRHIISSGAIVTRTQLFLWFPWSNAQLFVGFYDSSALRMVTDTVSVNWIFTTNTHLCSRDMSNHSMPGQSGDKGDPSLKQITHSNTWVSSQYKTEVPIRSLSRPVDRPEIWLSPG